MDSPSATTLDDDATGEDAAHNGVATRHSEHEQLLNAGELNRRATRSTIISTGQHVVMAGIRLATNVVVAGLLFPEAFGITNLLGVFMQGLQMFSDMGISANIVQSRRGNDPVYLNTLWTIQILRGLAICSLAIPLGFLVADIYGNPMLAYYMPVMALIALIDGFRATAVYTADRHMQLGRLAVMQVCTMALKSLFVVLLAWWWPDVWALVIGGVVYALLETIGGHVFLGGIRNRFCWDAESRKAATRFGRWIFISTILTFFAARSDTLVLGKFMTPELFGLYSIAFSLAFLFPEATNRIAIGVLFSLYARLTELDKNHLPARTVKMRRAIVAFAVPPIWALALIATPLISLLYDDRYSEKVAGTDLSMPLMIQILCVGAVARMLSAGMRPVLLALGNSFGHMLMNGIEILVMLAAMAVGGYYGGACGLLIGVSLSNIIMYAPWAIVAHRHGIWFPGLDAIAAGASVAVFAVAFLYC